MFTYFVFFQKPLLRATSVLVLVCSCFCLFNELDCSFSDARQYKGSVVRLRVLSASLDPKQS